MIEKKQIGRVNEWVTARGSLRTERLGREVLLFRPTGHLEVAVVELFENVTDDAIKDGKPNLFWDGEAMVGYDSAFRVRLGEYCVKVKADVASMNVYTPNRIVAMGAAVINVWLGGFFTIVKTRAELERLLAQKRSSPSAGSR